MTVDYRVGDVRDVLRTVGSETVSLVATSPPFLALRAYLDGDEREIGREVDPASFVQTLLGLTAELGRTLRPFGSIAVELGDTYSGSGGAGGDYDDDGLRAGQPRYRAQRSRGEWPGSKSLALVPQMFAGSLAYGRNLLTGQPSPAGRWLVRNLIVWHRTNPGTGGLADKVRPSTSYIVVATRSARRWYDLDAVRTPLTEPGRVFRNDARRAPQRDQRGRETNDVLVQNEAGAPPLDAWFDEYDGSHDVWTIPTHPSTLAHYAMWPARLAERLLLMMCPSDVCSTCGEPRRRLVATTREMVGRLDPEWKVARSAVRGGGPMAQSVRTTRTTLGWSDCGHDSYVPGLVLDPFAGSGTTLAVADLHGRDAVGIDLDERNRSLYTPRRAECARALFGTRPQLPGQLGMFDSEAAG